MRGSRRERVSLKPSDPLIAAVLCRRQWREAPPLAGYHEARSGLPFAGHIDARAGKVRVVVAQKSVHSRLAPLSLTRARNAQDRHDMCEFRRAASTRRSRRAPVPRRSLPPTPKQRAGLARDAAGAASSPLLLSRSQSRASAHVLRTCLDVPALGRAQPCYQLLCSPYLPSVAAHEARRYSQGQLILPSLRRPPSRKRAPLYSTSLSIPLLSMDVAHPENLGPR